MMESLVLSGAEARAARIALGLSQSAVAGEVGINRTYLSLFESGRFILPAKVAERLLDLFEEQGHEVSSGATARADTAETDRELSALRDEIAPLLGETVGPGLLWGVDEEDRDAKVGRVLRIMARAFLCYERARGNRPISIASENDQSRASKLVAHFVSEALGHDVGSLMVTG